MPDQEERIYQSHHIHRGINYTVFYGRGRTAVEKKFMSIKDSWVAEVDKDSSEHFAWNFNDRLIAGYGSPDVVHDLVKKEIDKSLDTSIAFRARTIANGKFDDNAPAMLRFLDGIIAKIPKSKREDSNG